MSAGWWWFTTFGLWVFAIGWTVGALMGNIPWGSFVVAVVWTGMTVRATRRVRRK